MKKMFKIRSLQTLFTILAVVGGLFLASSATAQVTQSTTVATNPSPVILDQALAKQQHNWVVESDAMAILGNAIANGSAQLDLLLPGSPQYQNLLFHIRYYKIVLGLLEEGNATGYSAQHGIDLMTGEGYGLDAGSTFTKAHLQNLYLEIVDMLSI